MFKRGSPVDIHHYGMVYGQENLRAGNAPNSGRTYPVSNTFWVTETGHRRPDPGLNCYFLRKSGHQTMLVATECSPLG